ncbi:type VI secretion system protein TssA [Pseudomonas japonica]|uniref:type VI secretion system protein TssA n=1 Tax=Pseudomonas TaxID=286 RepID=UPI002928B57B|nr:type VI secretion system protein TssA [Pseudomonas sp. zfem002]MDU9389025.1 type VI secretion system protein TssA [Pseudomonas sp. zfem002]
MTTPGFSQRVSQLLEPIPGELPCGKSMRYDAVFDRLEDLRREDDTSLPTGVWSTSEVKRADWAGVERLATQVLQERSKELMIAIWLGEAWLHREGFKGITDALALIGGLCERFPDDLHPQPEDGDLAWRAAPLAWMARRYDQVLLTRVQLFPESPPDLDGFSLYQWYQMKRRQVPVNDSKPAKAAAEAAQALQKKVTELARNTPVTWWLQGVKTIATAQAQLVLLDGWCDRNLGDDAPGFADLRRTLQHLEETVREFIALHPPQLLPTEPEAPAVVQSQQENSQSMDVPAPVESRQPFAEPRTRDEAYRQLLVIADYLARTEPHSPVPYLIRRGVEWGNKPLRDLLAELIESDAEARRLWTLLGVL